MIRKPPRGLFITGTSTEVGKTYVATLVIRQLRHQGHRVGVYKPAASGCRKEGDTLVAEDAHQLWRAAGRPGPLRRVCPQVFAAPLAPNLAAEEESKEIDEPLLSQGLSSWADQCDIVIVEGAGGLLSPIGPHLLVADLALEFGYPLVVVAANRLGVINQVLQTVVVASAYRGGLEVAGVVLNDVDRENDPSCALNESELRKRCTAPVLDRIRFGKGFQAVVDWWQLSSGT